MTIHTEQSVTGWKATSTTYPRVYGEGDTEQAAVEDLNWQILDDQDERLRINIAKGLADGAMRIATSVAICLLLLWAVGKIWPADYDATDAGDGERSGMRLYTDAQTGCQYLGSSLTPRLSATGEHICER
jgi:hypothetical protein